MADAPVPPVLEQLARDLGGQIDWCAALPDGSGAATMSFPLPKDHWLYVPAEQTAPPMPLRMLAGPERHWMAQALRAAGRYAYRAATDNGRCSDLDPDALLRNLVVGALGYHTDDGLSRVDPEMNPVPVPPVFSLTGVPMPTPDLRNPLDEFDKVHQSAKQAEEAQYKARGEERRFAPPAGAGGGLPITLAPQNPLGTRAPLVDRLETRARRAIETAMNGAMAATDEARCRELRELLERNPEVARILELIDQLGLR